MNYKSTAKKLIKAVGGRKNIESVDQCITRLKFHLKDVAKINSGEIKQIESIQAAFMQGDEYQVLPKEGTNELYKEISKPSMGKRMFGDLWKAS